MDESELEISRRTEQIERMQILYGEIRQIEKENKNPENGISRVQEIVLESSQIEEKSTTAVEKIIDAKILHTGTNYLSSNVKSFNTNLTSFNESIYVNGVLSFMENSNLGIGWNSLGPVTYHLFRKSHPLTFMLGTFNLEPHSGTEKPKVERKKRAPRVEKKVVEAIVDKEEQSGEKMSVYTHIIKCLKKCYYENNKKPVSYYKFIIDPDSFWRTVENIFHFSFLVNDGCVKMFMEDEVPYILPDFKKSSEKSGDFNHFCNTIDESDWKDLIEEYDVSSPCIPPLEV